MDSPAQEPVVLLRRARFLSAIETVKDVRQVLGRMPGPGVPDNDAGLFPTLQGSGIPPRLRRVLNRIRDQIKQNLFQAVTIPVDQDLIDLRYLDLHLAACQHTHF